MLAKKPTWLSTFKNFFLSPGRKPRKIRSGAFRGIAMEMSLRSQTQLFLGLYEREVQPWLVKLSKDIHSSIDIGVGEGEYTLYFLTKTSAQKVFSFEPSEEARRLFSTNLTLNGLASSPSLQLSDKFVGSSDNSHTCTLDSVSALVPMPCLVKIDVDGPEALILRGAQKLLASSDVRWIVELHSEQLQRECLEIFHTSGYTTRIIPNAWWRVFLPELRPCSLNHWVAAVPSKKQRSLL